MYRLVSQRSYRYAAGLALAVAAVVVSSAAHAGGSYIGKTGQAAESGYVWANQPNSPSYTPSLTYQYNSTGGTNTITRSGTGQYLVKFAGLKTLGGHVQVTAYGSGSERCKVVSWGPSGNDQYVSIRCYSNSGALADTYYTALFID